MEMSFICLQHYYTIGIYLLVHIGVLIFMSEVQGRFFILCYRRNVHESLEKETQNRFYQWKVYFFSGSFCISTMTPRAFYFLYWKYHPFRFAHERPVLFPQQKKNIYFFISKNKNDDQIF